MSYDSFIRSIKLVTLPPDQYYMQEFEKKQIVLHHTVSPTGVEGDLAWWRQTTARIATCQIIHHNGTPYQCFNSKYWGHHLGVKSEFIRERGFRDAVTRNELLNKQSIGIEIDSRGGLVEYKGKWYMAGNWKNGKHEPNLSQPVSEENITFYPQGYRGFEAFESYTPQALKTLEVMLSYFCFTYRIPHCYNEDMWDVSNNALGGSKGIWSHTSFREDKNDCHPMPELIQLLKNLTIC